MASSTSISQAAISTLINYVDATDGAAGNTRLAAGGVFNAPRSTTPVDSDNWWTNRTFGNNSTVFTSNDFGTEDAPGLVTLIEGLVPGGQFNLHAYFWVDNLPLSNWRLKASLSQMPPLPMIQRLVLAPQGPQGTAARPTRLPP